MKIQEHKRTGFIVDIRAYIHLSSQLEQDNIKKKFTKQNLRFLHILHRKLGCRSGILLTISTKMDWNDWNAINAKYWNAKCKTWNFKTNLPNHTYQSKTAKRNQTYQTKPTKPNLLRQISDHWVFIYSHSNMKSVFVMWKRSRVLMRDCVRAFGIFILCLPFGKSWYVSKFCLYVWKNFFTRAR